MLSTDKLKVIADTIETKAGVSSTTNQIYAGYWLRIALAAEAIAGASTTANKTIEGYMKRTALALEAKYGGSGAEENESYDGYMKRIVDALEISTGANVGTVENRFLLDILALIITPPDVTAPTLSAPTSTPGTTSATLGVTTNEANGTLYWFVGTSATPPTATALKAGTGATVSGSQGVTATGVQSVNASTGLTASTTYYAYFLHRDAAGNDSTIAATASFTTSAAGGTDYFPTLLTQPTLTGTATQGQTLTASGDTWANSTTPTRSYQWYRGSNPISGATAGTYTLTLADVGSRIQCFVTGTNTKGSWPAFTPLSAYVQSSVSATYNIAFGTKTRSGHGGYPVGVGVTITGGANATDWTVDDIGDLVPSGTYGAIKTFAASAYLLTLSNSNTVAITMVANRFSVAARTGSASNNDTTSVFQCRSVLLLTDAGQPVLGDEIYWRDREFNSTAAAARIRMRATAYTGTGRIHIWNLHTPAIGMDSVLSGEVLFPFDWRGATFYNNIVGTTTTSMLNYASVGYGAAVYDSTFEVGPNVVVDDGANHGASYIDAFRARGATTAQRNHFKNLGKSITFSYVAASSPSGGIVSDNINEGCWDDFMGGGWENMQFLRNFGFNFQHGASTHHDFLQNAGFTDGAAHTYGAAQFNIGVRGAGATSGTVDIQGIFNGDSTSPSTITGATIRNNAFLISYTTGLLATGFVNPDVSCNTFLNVFDADYGQGASPNATSIGVTDSAGAVGSGGTWNYNASNDVIATSIASQTGATLAGNKQVATNSTAYNAALAAYTNAASSWADAIAALTPKLNGSLKNDDGTYAGALLPNGCWNTGEVYV